MEKMELFIIYLGCFLGCAVVFAISFFCFLCLIKHLFIQEFNRKGNEVREAIDMGIKEHRYGVDKLIEQNRDQFSLETKKAICSLTKKSMPNIRSLKTLSSMCEKFRNMDDNLEQIYLFNEFYRCFLFARIYLPTKIDSRIMDFFQQSDYKKYLGEVPAFKLEDLSKIIEEIDNFLKIERHMKND